MSESGQVRYGDTVIAYTVRRHEQDRQSASVQVEPDGLVVVRAPAGASSSVIAAVVRRRARWIHQHQRDIAGRKQHLSSRDWVSGESHRYLGRRYMLKIRVDPEAQERVALSGGQLRVVVKSADASRVRVLVRAWYTAHASDWLRRRVPEISAGLPWVKEPPPVALRQMKSRWGSCSPGGRLTLNPLLIRASREAIDYVITHELCHLRHHDHGRAFYTLLARYVPGWKGIKVRLDGLAAGLFAEQG